MSFVISVDPGDEPLLEALEAELSARGAAVEILTPERHPGLAAGSVPAAAAALARHGVIVLVRAPLGSCTAEVVSVCGAELSARGSMEAFLRRLELSGSVSARPEDLSGEEEAIIRERLQKLGYL